MIRIITSSQKDEIRKLRNKLSINEGLVTKSSSALTRKVFGKALSPIEVVRIIIADVKAKGDNALLKYVEKLDGWKLDLDQIKVSKKDIDKAYSSTDKLLIKAMEKAKRNIETYQNAIKYSFNKVVRSEGMDIRLQVHPMERAGVYVPGGTATYPSSVLMNVLPARCAGVPYVCLATPCDKNGKVNETVLAAAKICGVDDVFRIGGVHGVAAMALGTKTIPKVDKIAGPGNLFVALAKRELYGHVDIDMIAGPSEVLIYADESASPDFTALDLMAQAEHYPGSAVLLSKSKTYAMQVVMALQHRVKSLSRSDKIKEDLSLYSLIVLVKDDQDAIDIINEFGPEHLQIMVKNTSAIVKKIRNAGAIFAGAQTPVAYGDYFAGPSHTLPTGGTSRFFSGVNVNDFIRTTAVMSATTKYGRLNIGLISRFAEAEGLTAHAASVKERILKMKKGKKK